MIHKPSMFDYKLGYMATCVALFNADMAYLAYIEIAVTVYTYNRPSWLFTLDMVLFLIMCGRVRCCVPGPTMLLVLDTRAP